MKYCRQSAKHLDHTNPSAILSRVSFKTDLYSKSHRKDNFPCVELQILSCSERVQLHDFGNTRERQLRKLNILRSELDKLHDMVAAA